MNELHLFAGTGGGILGGQLLGHTTVCAVEIEEYPRQVLLQRQRDGVLPKFPIWDDVCTFDGKPWRGTVDVICGGFPCQDISAAGKGTGIGGKRSGLWKEYARIIDEIRPKFVFAENSPLLRRRGLDVVLGDLSQLGYDAKWCVLGAWHVGAPHRRNRMWVLASNLSVHATLDRNTDRNNELQEREICKGPDSDASRVCKNVADANAERLSLSKSESVEIWPEDRTSQRPCVAGKGWWIAEPDVGRVANGMAHRVDRIKAIGNGQVPAVAATAWRILSQ